MEDPFGTPARVGFLLLGLAGVAAYGALHLRGGQRTAVILFVAAAGAVYAFLGRRARAFARNAAPAEMRERFVRSGKARLRAAPTLPLRGILWLGLGTWAWISYFRGRTFPIADDPMLPVFLGGMGVLLGAKYLMEWRLEIPRLRRDVEAEDSGP
jgi:hypothetical protein